MPNYEKERQMSTVKAKSLKFVEIAKGAYSGFSQEKHTVIKTDADWQNLWDSHSRNVMPQPAAPAVDFKKNMVVAVFLGMRSSGGYSITIDKIEDAGKDIIVTLSKKSPQGMATMAITHPFHFVTVKASKKPVEFRFAKVDPSCGCSHSH
jgi:hypothetical protein